MKLTAFINGKKFTNGREIEIFNPSNDELLGSVPSCSKDDVDMAFEAANNAFKSFKKSKISFRVEILEKISKVLLENTDELAELISKEVAKPIKDSKTEVVRSVDIITETIKEYQKIINSPRVYGEEELKTNKKKAIYHLEPLGVVLAITPFNYPINLLVAKIAPAIISGNTMVIKAASSGSLVTAKFIELIHEQNIPDGIINLVSGAGREIGDYIVTNKHVKMISFTGSTNVAKNICKNTAMIPLVLENGGKDPAIVLDDADLDLTVNEIISGAFSFSGQRCTAIKRVIVQKNIADNLIQKLNNKINNLNVGYPFDDNVFITPLINKKSLDYNLSLLEDAKQKNAILNQEIKYEGNLLWPVLVSNVKTDMRIWKEEPFGPILPIITFETISEAIELANDSDYGLQCSIFTKNIDLAIKMHLDIEAGTININKSSSRGPDILPFFGVKDSGFGIQGITDAILSMNKLKGLVVNK